jgi:alginate O-acetyltransferase complex protein AlgI
MVFLSYEFVFFGLIFFILYYCCNNETIREFLLLGSGVGFLYLYGGYTSVAVVTVLLIFTYIATKVGGRISIDLAICFCAGALLFFKYSNFISLSVAVSIFPQCSKDIQTFMSSTLPTIAPLGISFFTFEFIHYLVDVRKGRPPISKISDFMSFVLFWPTMVAGPIKRYEQFIPALQQGLSGPTSLDLSQGFIRIAIGLIKKWAADNLTGWIIFLEPQFSASSLWMRWVFIGAISARILLDFSGYSDIAIGFARMLGIKVPENFNWPYLAKSLGEFWQRWHMSLSSWIRDYIYIPLGGNRLGLGRRVVNGLIAMALCGLWHGPSWNFVVWGVYHGIGLATVSLLGRLELFQLPIRPAEQVFLVRLAMSRTYLAVSWASTLVFVGIGWLLFFYPVDRAMIMAFQLFAR